MAFVLADRVRDTTTTTGTGTVTLSGTSPTGYQTFGAGIGNGNNTYYTINADSQWEVGIGTYTASGTTLSRNTVLASSNGGALVDFAIGIKDVFCDYPAEKAVTDIYGTALAATTAANIGGGAAGSIPYQTAANTTAMLATGTGVLIGGTTPSYTASPSLTQVTVAGDPSTALQVATKQYVDGLVSSGITYHEPVKYEVPNTTGNLNALYNQPGGAGNGVGATLTNNGTKAAFAPDGPTASVGDRILVYNQTSAFQNGIYTVTTVGTPDPGGTNWVLTRATDADTYGIKDVEALGNGDSFFVTSGDTGAGETYVCNTTGTITFGTTAITFVQVSDATLYTAGNGLQLTGGTVFSLIAPVTTVNGGTGLTAFTSGGAVYATSTSALTTGTLPATAGGTGNSSYAAGDLLYATSSTAIGRLADVATGNALISGGVGADPSYGKIGLTTHISGTLAVGNGGTGATTLTGYLVGNGTSAFTATATIPTSALSGTISLTTQVSGTLGAGNGGTGISSYTVGDILYASGTTALSSLADVATGNALISGGVSNAPLWGKIGLTTHVSGTLPVANGGSGATTLTGYLKGNGTSAFTASATIPAGDITGAALTEFDDTNVTMTLGGSPSTALLAATSMTLGWTGQLAVSRGGTGNSTLASGYLLKGNGVSPTSASVIYDDGTNAMIGTTTALGRLTIQGNTNANLDAWVRNDNAGSSSRAGLVLNASGNSWRMGMGSTANNSNALTWNLDVGGANTEYMRLTTGGNLGLGTSSPAGKFSSNTGASGTYVSIPGNVTGWDATASLFGAAGSSTGAAVAIGMTAAGGYISSLAPSVAWQNLYYQAGTHYWYNGVNQLGVLNTAGDLTAIGSMRAPIFYDSNNTAYYGDFASTSSLNSLIVGTNGSGLAYDAAATGKLYFGSAGGDASTNYHITTNMENVGGNYSKLDFKWYTGQRFYAHYAYGGVRFKEITTGNTLFSVGEGDLRVRVYDSISAPIYYDSANTSFYLDPASGSNLNGTLVNNGGTAMTAGWNRNMMLASTFPVLVFNSAGVKYSGIGVDYGSAPAGMYFWVNGSSADVTGTGTIALSINTGNFVVANDFRATIFYDSNNSAYYIDPASTSNLVGLQINGTLNVLNSNAQFWGSTNGAYQRVDTRTEATTLSRAHWYGVSSSGTTSNFRHAWYDNAAYFNVTAQDGEIIFARTAGDTIVRSTGSFRAPIFYDSDNTAYYVDPNGGSRMSSITLDSGDVLGAAITFNNMNQVHGQQSDFNAITNFGVRYVQGATNGPAISGATQYYGFSLGLGSNYPYSDFGSQFYWPRTPVGGNPYPSVRFRESSTWGAWSKIYAGWADAPSGATFTATGDFRAPIFYDSNNTAYFCDPNNVSSLYGVAVRGDNDATGIYNQIFFWGTGGTTTSAIGFKASAGAFVSPTGNGDGYNTYLTMDTAGRGWVFRRGTGGTDFTSAFTSGWILNNGIWQAQASMRSPIFYDSNDTNYYLDPATNSRLNQAQFVNRIAIGDGNGTPFLNAGSPGVWLSYNGGVDIFMGSESSTVAGFYISSAWRFRVNGSGDVTAGGNVTAYSDARIKKDVTTIDGALDLVSKMRGVRYTRIDTEKPGTGVIAQEMLEVMPEVVQQGVGDDDTLSVAYGNLVGVLIEAIKELEARVAELEGK
jgi:hypothetical protein